MTTEQTPLQSGYGARTTALEVVSGLDLSGRTAIVTGGYTGLGFETTRALAQAGADVLVGGRSPDKAGVLADIPGARFAPLDLADPASIAAFSADFVASGKALPILINNAAIMACPLERDARGYESQFATNHLGHFSLILGLWPALADAGANGGARVVCLSSIGHRISGVDLADPHFNTRAYDKWVAYGQAKSANSLCAVELDRRGQSHGVRAFAVHPGGIMTELQRSLSKEEMVAFGWMDDQGNVDPMFKSPAEGAATSVWAATTPMLAGKGGVYCEDCDVSVAVAAADKGYVGVRPQAIDRGLAADLWALSERQTGLASAI